jgi:hypothetical protein
MRYPRFVTKKAVPLLELEQPSVELRTLFTRELRECCKTNDSAVTLTNMNDMINRARTLQCRKLFRLDSDDWGDYETPVYAWHQGEFELMLRGLTTVEFIEFVAEMVQDGYLNPGWVNKYFEEDELAVRLGMTDRGVRVEVLPLAELKELASSQNQPHWHANIRLLVSRMEDAKTTGDHASLLHAGASIFETLAKQVIGTTTVQNQTLGGIFTRYRKDSSLPEPVLDYIKDLYDRRGSEPLAAHGSLAEPPNLSEQEAVTLIETTKAFVAIEYRLGLSSSAVEEISPIHKTGRPAGADTAAENPPQDTPKPAAHATSQPAATPLSNPPKGGGPRNRLRT